MSFIVPLYKKCNTDKCLLQLNAFSFTSAVVLKKLKTVSKLNINYIVEIVYNLTHSFFLICLILSMIIRLLANNSLLFLSVFAEANLC